MKNTLPLLTALMLASLVSLCAAERPPNVIIFLTDDQSYADVGCFGAKGFKTPNFDRMAAEGMKFTSFYVAQPVCTASRAAIMTGFASDGSRTTGRTSTPFAKARSCGA